VTRKTFVNVVLNKWEVEGAHPRPVVARRTGAKTFAQRKASPPRVAMDMVSVSAGQKSPRIAHGVTDGVINKGIHKARVVGDSASVETSWGKEGLRWIRQIGARITAKTGEKRATTFLLQRMSLTVQRGNVVSVLGTLPVGRSFEEIFLL